MLAPDQMRRHGGRRTSMPTTKERIPDTLKRSPAKARRTYAKALDNAHREYPGDEERAHRVAFSALKHSFKKGGDHWEPQAEKGPADPQTEKGPSDPQAEKGPSDPQAANSGRAARTSRTPTGGGKEVGSTKQELMDQARRYDVPGRSRMSKDQLTRAVRKAMR